jgi:hypothetical protein
MVPIGIVNGSSSEIVPNKIGINESMKIPNARARISAIFFQNPIHPTLLEIFSPAAIEATSPEMTSIQIATNTQMITGP